MSDVHANLPALEAVLAAMASMDIERIACAGDLVGYGPHPAECVRRVAEVAAVTVAGNHDLLIIGDLARRDFPARALASLDWTRGRLRAIDLQYLRSLPRRARLGPFHLAHGSLADPRRYVDRRSRALTELARLRASPVGEHVIVLGHTHRQRHFAAGVRGSVARHDIPVVLADGTGHVVNPGSVGQSRDWERVPRARFMVLDDLARTAAWHVVPYDHAQTRRDLQRAGLPPGWVHLRPGLRRELATFVRDRWL
jgi:predicted phosphodiesterase